MLNNEDAIKVINHLIEISKDGEEGFRKSAENLDHSGIKSFLLRRSKEVKESALELQNLVVELGGIPTDSISVGGYLHQRWVDLKAAIVHNDNLAILNELERGEDVALKAYRDANEQDLPPQANIIVLRQLNGAQRNHDEVKQLRDAEKVRAE